MTSTFKGNKSSLPEKPCRVCGKRFIATPEAEARSAAMIPDGRIGEPAEVAQAIAYLLSPHAAHVSGQVLRVDGGQAMLRPLPKQK